ncbi:tetratricopeptide repeat protein [Aliagarivorans marinus]|uniref:tetratricopeptide repeat protein n=1 Tax=Aliagarivorans marinus TaxID=561965 RepID=UPI00041CED9F|nr:tetratricopeptide repeat protein [Aliagarivorans marinus]
MNKLKSLYRLLAIALLFGPALSPQLQAAVSHADCSLSNTSPACIQQHRVLAEQGSAESAYWLGKMTALSIDTPDALNESANWYRQAHQLGSAKATNALGLLYYHGAGVPQDYAKAKELFQTAANRGDARGLWNLGRMYHYGRGVEQNYQQAESLFEMAAIMGVYIAEETLAYYRSQQLPSSPAMLTAAN